MADETGTFRVPSIARTVVAYVDTNHNESFDRYAEPSGDCERAGNSWTCSLVPQRTTVQRSISSRNEEQGDQTLVFWEDYRNDGARVDSSRLCLRDRCTNDEVSPFVSRSPSKVRMFSLCGAEGFPDEQATIRGSTAATAVSISHPGRLDVTVRTERIERPESGLLLHLDGHRFDRLLVWAGTVGADSGFVKYVHWSSETASVAMIDTPSGVEVRVPSALVQVCETDPACEIVVQALEYWTPPGAAVVSATEYRATVSFRGKR